jgi:hypothetical protein
MCRNIKKLFNYKPHASSEEIHNAALQYVRKISGFNKPSQINEKAFNDAVLEIAHASTHLLQDLNTNAKPSNREVEKEKAKARAIKRFGVIKSP